ncbi:hypothetical protein N781_02635 [Pontibacillus halophilus JSM 076056 = DSM 19796]|uniref:WYL domain-containing protein n=1 Tax=Pontibacillus halophilus JSM 076056 = DSM 19796 TaxID=1385510 RepID=A0A0A5GLP3_9BACI|nr:hypothetical protein [Pontibacillus halophilus]KGX92060.1 hypothetical protein N781_02635 [Pontibacillus halophilus JSM 076056 = DSM 19796]
MHVNVRHYVNEQVELMYLSKDGTVTHRKVKLLKTTSDYLYGYCYLRCAHRKFSKDRILAVLPLQKSS